MDRYARTDRRTRTNAQTNEGWTTLRDSGPRVVRIQIPKHIHGRRSNRTLRAGNAAPLKAQCPSALSSIVGPQSFRSRLDLQ
jgi:hypothetical protein